MGEQDKLIKLNDAKRGLVPIFLFSDYKPYSSPYPVANISQSNLFPCEWSGFVEVAFIVAVGEREKNELYAKKIRADSNINQS